MTTFAIIGGAGYIAPRHMQAIADVGGELVAVCDLHDSVGVMDSFAPDAGFFASPPAFFGCCKSEQVDYLVVCTPNHRHVDHVLMGFAAGMDVICEKPLCLGSPALEAIAAMEKATGKRVWVVQQLRLVPAVQELRLQLDDDLPRRTVDVKYVSRRGSWYHASWKGDPDRSGGVAANIGAHLFDLLPWCFGPVLDVAVDYGERDRKGRIRGTVALAQADVAFLLSVRASDLPEGHPSAYRKMMVDGQELDLTGPRNRFTKLHSQVYDHILTGHGCGLDDVRPGLMLLERIGHGY